MRLSRLRFVLLGISIGGGLAASFLWRYTPEIQVIGIGSGFVAGSILGFVCWALTEYYASSLVRCAPGRFLLDVFYKTESKGRGFQFSLRTLLLFVLVFAILCSWFAVKLRQAQRQREAVALVRTLHGTWQYEWPFVDEDERSENASAAPEAPGPEWVRNLLGVDFVSNISSVHLGGTAVSDSDLKPIQHLTELRYLNLENTQITDAGLESIMRLSKLLTVHLTGSAVTREGVKKLQEALPECEIYY